MTENAVEPRANGEVAEVRPYEKFAAFMVKRAKSEDGERRFEVLSKQVDKILTVAMDDDSSMDDIWNADEGGTVSGQDYVGKPFQIHGYGVAESSGEEISSDLGVYVLIDATDLETRSPIIINCGSATVVTKLRALELRNAFTENAPPCYAIFEGIKTNKGFTLLKLRPYRPVQIPVSATTE